MRSPRKRPAHNAGDPATNQGPTHGTPRPPHLLDLTIGAILGALQDCLKTPSRRCANDAPSERSSPSCCANSPHGSTDHARRSTPPCESASFPTITSLQLASTHRTPSSRRYGPQKPSRRSPRHIPRSPHHTERHNAARRAHRAIMTARATQTTRTQTRNTNPDVVEEPNGVDVLRGLP
jgi:hypothetical protein